MNYFDDVNSKQAIAFHRLIKLIRRLRVIGNLNTNTTGHSNSGYCIRKTGYDGDKNSISQEELLETIYGKLRVNDPLPDED